MSHKKELLRGLRVNPNPEPTNTVFIDTPDLQCSPRALHVLHGIDPETSCIKQKKAGHRMYELVLRDAEVCG